MGFEQTFEDIALPELIARAEAMREGGWRCMNILCTAQDEATDITYSFMRDARIVNLQVKGVPKGEEVPSIQGFFPAVFPFENEAHDLFGVNVTGMLLDFEDSFYQVSAREPMTILTPEQRAAREKAAKIAKAQAAKAAREAKAAAAGSQEPAPEAQPSQEGGQAAPTNAEEGR